MRMTMLASVLVLALSALAAAAEPLTPSQQSFRDIYQQLIEINTTESSGSTLQAAQAMANRLLAGGLPAADVQVFQVSPRKGNLVARLRGSGARKPILLLAHLDVVEAPPEDWRYEPFKLTEADGTFWGRGAIDDKAMAAIFVANLIDYVQQGLKPDRDIILALTTDEELSDSPDDGVHWLVQHHRDLVDAEFAINEGGGGTLRDGKPLRIGLQLAEKIYQTYMLEVSDPGGHSASGRRDSAIYRLADALRRLSQFDFPPHLNAVTRSYFEHLAEIETPASTAVIRALLAGDTDPAALAPLTNRPDTNAQMRTTCVTTMLSAGQAENALPQTARATVNCRILPDEDVAGVEQTLKRVIADERVVVTPKGSAVLSPPSPMIGDVLRTVTDLVQEMWPGVPLNTTMSGGYTDSRWLRNAGIPAYGISGLFSEPNSSGVHGRNEHIGVQALYDSKEFLFRLVKRLAAPEAPQH